MKEIKYIITTSDECFEVRPKGEFIKCPDVSSKIEDECSIKHLGKQIYEVKYFDPYITGSYLSNVNSQNRINSKMILFPSNIKRVVFK